MTHAPDSGCSQKASVRLALNEAREEQQTASSNRDKWERRVVEGNLDYVD